MAGALSGHLLDAHNPFNSSIVTHGPMSFNPVMHGTPYAQQSFSLFGSSDTSFSNANESISEETAKSIANLQVKLNQKLGPEYISQRPGPGGGPKLTYVEGWKIINLANEVFGFNGWCSSIVSLTTDFCDYSEETRRYCVGVTAIMRVTLRDGVYHEDIGYGILENAKSKGAALDKCKKEAVTDGLKRALRNFGNVLGNCLYDKSYASEIVKMKVETVKLNKDELHRRAEVVGIESKANVSSSTSISSSNQAQANGATHLNTAYVTPTRPPMQQNQTKPHTSLPSHMRSEVQVSVPGSNSSSMLNATNQRPVPQNPPQQPTGLNTPMTTPLNQRINPQAQPQPDRRVSFAQPQLQPPAAPASKPAPPLVKHEPHFDSDDYGLGDDEEFLALADLGPPIAEGDSGRPIDHEEGLLRPLEDEDDEDLCGRPPANLNPHVGASVIDTTMNRPDLKKSTPPGMSRAEAIAAALQASAEESTVADSSNDQNSAHGRTASSSSVSMRPPPVPQQQQNQNQNLKSTSFAQQRHQQYMNQRPNQNQNQNPNQDTNQTNQHSTGSGDASKRTSTTAMGGFHFPPGVNPIQRSSSSGIGLKRPADVMTKSSAPTNCRSGRTDMGLQLQQGGAGSGLLPGGSVHGQRQVLGSLELGEGGDVKRMRR